MKSVPSNRIIQLDWAIERKTATKVTRALFECDSKNLDPILLYINSPGGFTYLGFAITGVMKLIKIGRAHV